MTSQFGLSQIITETTHIFESSSLCIDFIFTTQPNLVVELNLTWWLNLVFTHHCIQIATIKLYSQNLIYKYIAHHHTHDKSGITSKQILNLLDGQLLTLIGIEPFSIPMLTRKFLSSATLY